MVTKKVLATSWHPSATNALIPVLKRLKEDSQISLKVLGGEYSSPIFNRNGIAYSSLTDYNLSDLSSESMNLIIEKENPNLILTGASFQENSPPKKVFPYIPDQTLVYSAKKFGIPTMRVHDWWDPKFSLKYDDIFTGEKLKFLPDYLAVMDEYTKNKMKEEGFPENIISVTGTPELESLKEIKDSFNFERKEKVKTTLGSNGPLFFYAGGIEWQHQKDKLGYWNIDHFEICQEVLNSIKDSNISLVMAMHPRIPEEDKKILLEYLAKSADNRIKFIPGLGSIGLNAEEVALASEATFTAFSTVGYKSAYLGTPCISLQPNLDLNTTFIEGNPLFYVDHANIFPIGLNKDSCKNLVLQAITDKSFLSERKEIISKSKFNLEDLLKNNNPTDKVLNLIQQAIN